tara:strand:+ start:864 stop:968 length:105 start_codon:yes stop_codon:yes gene_type:complete
MINDKKYRASAKCAFIGYMGILICLLYLGIKAQL